MKVLYLLIAWGDAFKRDISMNVTIFGGYIAADRWRYLIYTGNPAECGNLLSREGSDCPRPVIMTVS